MLQLVAIHHEAVDHEKQRQDRDRGQVGAGLGVGEEGFGRARDHLHVAHEGQAGEDHEDRGGVFHWALEGAEGIVGGGEPAR